MSDRSEKKPEASAQNANRKKSRHIDFKSFGRIIKMLFKYYPGLSTLTAVFIVFSSVVSSIPAIFLQNVIEAIGSFYESGDWNAAREVIVPKG